MISLAKIYKVETYLIDINDNLSDENVAEAVSDYLSGKFDCLIHQHNTKITESNGFDWSDDLDLNNLNCKKENYYKYFKPLYKRCSAYHERVLKEPRYDTITGKITHYVDVTHGECWGTRERDKCDCDGYEYKCSFYPNLRKQAKVNND